MILDFNNFFFKKSFSFVHLFTLFTSKKKYRKYKGFKDFSGEQKVNSGEQKRKDFSVPTTEKCPSAG